MEVLVRLVLGQQRGLDLVVDDRWQQLPAVGPPGLEVEVAQDAPLEPGRDGVLDLPLDGDRLAKLRNQLSEGELDRVEPELECAVLAQVGFPGDPELLALGLAGGFPGIPEGVLDLVDGQPLAMVEEVPVVERDRVVDLPPEEPRSGGRALLAEDVAPAPVLGFCAPSTALSAWVRAAAIGRPLLLVSGQSEQAGCATRGRSTKSTNRR